MIDCPGNGWGRSAQGRPARITAGVLETAMLLAVGCASAAQPSVVLKERVNLEVDTLQLRLQVRSLAKPFSGIIEGAADSILAHATTQQERIAGLRIKVDGVPAVQGALFLPDPVAAAFETAALLVQTRVYVESGPGAKLPPLVRDGVLGAIDSMRARVYTLGERIGATPDGRKRFWDAAEEWGHAHPITTTFTARETTQDLFADYLAREPHGLYAFAGRLEETAVDMSLRFDLYGEYIAKQVRWQGELLLEESLARDYPARAIESLGAVPLAVTALPFDADAQREALLTAMRAERELILDFIREERLDTVRWAQLERQALTGLLGQERQAVLDALRAEREAALASLHDERAAAMRDLEGLIARAMDSSRETVIDHAMWRLAQLLAITLPGCFLAAWFLIWYARRPRG